MVFIRVKRLLLARKSKVLPSIPARPKAYCCLRQRILSLEATITKELDALLEAIRFSIAWRGAWFFSLMQRGEAGEQLQRALRSWYRWYVISEEIARFSHMAIEQV